MLGVRLFCVSRLRPRAVRASTAPLMCAAFGEAQSGVCGVAVARLLLSYRACVDARCDNGTTPFIVSAAFSTTAMSQALLDAGAEIDAVDCLGETALHKAALRGDMEVVRFLVDRGADTRIRAKSGFSAADLAEEEGLPEQLPIVAYLRAVTAVGV